jgi:hypothetical protein
MFGYTVALEMGRSGQNDSIGHGYLSISRW